MVNVAAAIFAHLLLFIADPFLTVDDIFIVEIFARLDLLRDGPLIRLRVERHLVSHLPIVKRPAQIARLVLRPLVRHLERLRLPADGTFIQRLYFLGLLFLNSGAFIHLVLECGDSLLKRLVVLG